MIINSNKTQRNEKTIVEMKHTTHTHTHTHTHIHKKSDLKIEYKILHRIQHRGAKIWEQFF